MSIKIQAIVKALPGDKVMVENYNLRPPRWEEGEVHSVELDVKRNRQTRPIYGVWTKRKVRNKRTGFDRSISLTVGDDRIQLIR